jgi:hypothetical protein
MQSDHEIINALWDAHRKGSSRPLREAIHAARDYGLTDAQIAAELLTTAEEVGRLAHKRSGEAPRYWLAVGPLVALASVGSELTATL